MDGVALMQCRILIWKIKQGGTSCPAPAARRQTVGAGESCWMQPSPLPHDWTMTCCCLDGATKRSQKYPVRKAAAPLLFSFECGRVTSESWPAVGDTGGVGGVGGGSLAFKVEPSPFSLHLLGPLNNFTSRFLPHVFSHSLAPPAPSSVILSVSLHPALFTRRRRCDRARPSYVPGIRMVFITRCKTKKKKKRNWNLNQATHEVHSVSVSCRALGDIS